jgi:hypothetical protein
MRIKFKKLIHSTDSEPPELLNTVIDELNKASYQITNQNQSIVEFKNNIWRPGSRIEVFMKVDGGKFEIISDQKIIGLSYYLSPVFEILAFCVVAFFGSTLDCYILFFIIFIALMFYIRVINQKDCRKTTDGECTKSRVLVKLYCNRQWPN